MDFTPLKQVSVCILSYNRCEELRYTLEVIFEIENLWLEVIVGDNNSTDGTHMMLAKEFPQVKLINTGGNHGVQGWNLAFEEAQGEWLLCLDDDSHPKLNTWSSVLRLLNEGTDAAAIAFSITSLEGAGEKIPMNGPIKTTCSFSSAGVLLRREIVQCIGGFDAGLFLFTNELDWAARAVAHGYQLLMCEEAQVVHRATPLQRSSWRHAYYYTRNLSLWIMKYAPETYLSRLLSRYIQNVYLFSILHRTFYYWKAMREAKRIMLKSHACRLTEAQYAAFNIDFRMPFVYLK